MKKYKHTVLALALTFFSAEVLADSCKKLFKNKSVYKGSVKNSEYNKELQASFQQFERFFDSIGEQLHEKEYVFDLLKLALISREHLFIKGSPGNAKSMIADVTLENIVDKNGNPSYFRGQITKESTMSHTHGPIDPVKIFDEKVFERILDQGMLMKKRVFLDELPDGGPNILRNILGALAEREHNEGGKKTKGEIETTIAATNKYSSEIYEQAGGDGPRAVFDRFAFVAYIPKILSKTSSTQKIIEMASREKVEVSKLFDGDLVALQELIGSDAVGIPKHVSAFIALLRRNMMIESEARETASIASYKESLRSAENPEPPYYSTKVFSDRTVFKSSVILQTQIIMEWLKSKQTRSLNASIEDVKLLEKFFTLNGPESEFLVDLKDISVNRFEINEIDTVLYERELFRGIYNDISEKINITITEYGMSDVLLKLDARLNETEKSQIIAKLATSIVRAEEAAKDIDEYLRLKPEMIAASMVKETFFEKLVELIGEVEAERAIEFAKQQKLEIQNREEERRLQKLAVKERQAKEGQLEQQKFEDYKLILKEALANGRSGSEVDVKSSTDSLIYETDKSVFIYNKGSIIEYVKNIDQFKEWDVSKIKSIVEGKFAQIDNIFSTQEGKVILTSNEKFWVFSEEGALLTNHALAASNNILYIGIYKGEMLALDRKKDKIYLVNILNGTYRDLDFTVESLNNDNSLNLSLVIGFLSKGSKDKKIVQRQDEIYILESNHVYRIDLKNFTITSKFTGFRYLTEDKSNTNVAFAIDVESNILLVKKIDLSKSMKAEIILEVENIDEVFPDISVVKLNHFAVISKLDLLLLATHDGVRALSLKDGSVIADKAFASSGENGHVYVLEGEKIMTFGRVDDVSKVQVIDLGKSLNELSID